MKKSFIFSILVVAVTVAFSACGGNDDPPAKSQECEMLTFTESGKIWTINGNTKTISAGYLKSERSRLGNAAPAITVSSGATVSPKSGDPVDLSDGKQVTYTVTAEDGKTTKTYTAQASEVTVQ